MSIDVNVQNDLVIVTESSEDITVNVSNAAGPAGANGVGVPTGGSTGQVLKKLTNTDYDTYWALDGGGVPYSGATGDVNLGEFQLRAGQVTLDTSPTGTAAVATTRWNDTIGSSETTLKGGSVILKNGVDLVARVVNKVSPNTTLTKAAYQAVRVSGAQGQRLAVAYAQANNDANSADTIGLVCETIPTNQEGFIITMGQLENINTTGSLQGETWADGDVLYLSPTIPGAITKVKPTGAGHIVVIGYVEYAHINNGKIYVKVMNGWELDELHDVDIVTPANNEALIYESSTQLWKNKTIATALGYTPISGSGVTGQVAYWNGTNSQTGSNNLFWDAYNSRLGIGTNSSLSHQLTIYNALSSFLAFNIASGSTFCGIRLQVAGFDRFTMAGRGVDGNLVFSRFNASGVYQSDSLTIFNANGNIALGGSIDGGQRLQVYGDAFVRGSGATSATVGLQIQNSSNTNLFRVFNDGYLVFGNTSLSQIFPTADGATVNTGAQTIAIVGGTGGYPSIFLGRSSAVTNTFAGTQELVRIIGNFTPSSGSHNFEYLRLQSTINQTGGANGITRGLYVNPTLTAAADWRSIEWSNNSGWGLYGAGTAPNYLNGNLGIGTTSPIAKLETFNNSIYIASALSMYSNTASDESIFYFRRGRGTLASPLTVTNGDIIGSIRFAVQYNSSVGGYNTNAKIDSIVDSNGANLCFHTNSGGLANATLAERMRLTAAGRLLLGTVSESTFLLDVNGTARVSDNLLVSKNQNAETSLTVSNTNVNTSVEAKVILTTDANAAFVLSKYSSAYTGYKIFSASDSTIYNGRIGSAAIAGHISILNDYSLGKIKFAAGGSSTAHMTINETGIVDIPNQFVVGTSGNTIPSAALKARFVSNTTGSDVEINGNGYARLFFNDYSQGANLKYYEMLNFGSDFKISRLNDLNTLRTERLTIFGATGNVFVGSSPSDSTSALLNVSSTTKGFLPPRMTTTQKNAIGTPAAGLMVFDTTLAKLCVYSGTAWETITSI